MSKILADTVDVSGKQDTDNNNSSGERVRLSTNKYHISYIKKPLLDRLTNRLTNVVVVVIGETEKLILALIYKSPKRSYVLAKMLGLSLDRVQHCLSNLKTQGLIKTQGEKTKFQHNSKFYSFEPDAETFKKLPKDVKDYIKNYEASKNAV